MSFSRLYFFFSSNLAEKVQSREDVQVKVPAIVDLQWVPDQPGFLAAVYYSAHIILWNTYSSTKVWRFDIADAIQSIAFSPFDTSQALVGTEGHALYVILKVSLLFRFRFHFL